MSEMIDKEWDELADIWRAQPVPDIQKIAAKVKTQRRRLVLTQAFEVFATTVIIAMAVAAPNLSSDAWLRGYIFVLAGYAILQQYLMARSVRGLWKRDAESVKDMLEHSARHNLQRIYRLRLRYLESAVLAIVSVPLFWHLSDGDWGTLFSNRPLRFLVILMALMVVGNSLWAFRRIPRFRRALDEAESMRKALAGGEEEE